MTLCLFLMVMSLHELFCLRNAAMEVRAGTVLLARRVKKRFWYTGAFLASALLTFIFCDSLLFESHNDAAIASPVLLGEDSEEECDAQAILVRYHPDAPSDWRCPTGVVLMGESSHPFLPWPDYRQGKSRQMSDNINTLIKHAEDKSEKKAG